jgi:penicillin-insensitive murein endopeptidase
MPSGHASHQIGLDVDIMFAAPRIPLDPVAREAWEPQSMLTPDGKAMDLSRFGPDQIAMLKTMAGLPQVDRIFVNPVIKRHLCQTVLGDRTWLHKLRPWFGHAAHFHTRLSCPADQPLCEVQAPVPPGDGCDETLDAWFKPPPPPSNKPQKPPPPKPPLPAACTAVLAAP